MTAPNAWIELQDGRRFEITKTSAHIMKLVENGITFPDDGCVLEQCDHEQWGDLSICYCEARIFTLELEAAGRCTNCSAIPTCECHANGCPDYDTLKRLSYFHVCEPEP
jgi:hypothetical protein